MTEQKTLFVRIPGDLKEEFDSYASRTKISTATLTARALREFLEKRQRQQHVQQAVAEHKLQQLTSKNDSLT